MRTGRVIFRPQGIHQPNPDQVRSIMFWIGLDDRPTSPADCQPYEQPIRTWLARTHYGDKVADVWFSRPELLTWQPWPSPRSGQDILVEGGVTMRSGRAYRLLLELHAGFCNCAWCQDEEIVAGEWEWVEASGSSPRPPSEH